MRGKGQCQPDGVRGRGGGEGRKGNLEREGRHPTPSQGLNPDPGFTYCSASSYGLSLLVCKMGDKVPFIGYCEINT